MTTIYDRPLTLDELVEFAKRQRLILFRHHARSLCLMLNIVPHERRVGRYLNMAQCEDNLGATVQWLKNYLGDADIQIHSLDLDDCVCAFRAELHNKIPTNYWGDCA